MKTITRFACLLLVLLLTVPLTGCDKPTSAPEVGLLDDFRNIPGITKEEIEAVRQIQQKYDSFQLAMMSPNTECFYDMDGEMRGFSVDMCNWLSDIFDIPFTPAFYDWNEILDGLADHSIDFTGEITATPERREFLYMTNSIGERTLKIISRVGSKKLTDMALERPVRYCFLGGTTTHSYIEPYVSNIEAVYAESFSEIVALFADNKIDAFIADGSAEAVFDADPTIMTENFSPTIYAPVSLSTQNPELSVVIDLVQKILDSDYNRYISELYQQGYTDYQRYKLAGQFTHEEAAYIQKHIQNGASIPFIIEFDHYPVTFYNEREAAWQGVGYDVLMEIEALTGLDFQVINAADTPWPEMLPWLSEGKALVACELIRTKERESHYIWADEPYLTDYFALISTSEFEDVGVSEIVHSRVGLLEGSAHADFFRECFPEHKNVVEYPDVFKALDALERGDIDLFVSSRNMLLNVTNYLEKPGFKTNLVFARSSDSFFGFPKEETVLCSIVSKAQHLVDAEAIADRWQRKVFDYKGAMSRTRVPLWIGLGTLGLLLFALLVVIAVRNKRAGALLEETVRERTKELEIQTQTAQIASQAKGDFLARMSHEIRTPLNAIIGMAAIAKSAETREKANENIEELEKASHHLLGILNDVLDMSKIESGKFILVQETLSLHAIMSEVAVIIQQRCDEQHIAFVENQNDVQNLSVIGDKLRLKQVLINLLGNAVKFTPAGGRIRFLLDVQRQSGDVADVQFTVEDTGIGISEEQQGKLFFAFEQADSHIAIEFGGTGLGLSISQSLVNMMGGTINVESELGKGSQFSFCLPMKISDSTEEEIAPAPVKPPDLCGRRMLLVEDIEINRVILRELLKETNLEIDEAEDGQRAVEMFEKSPPGTYDVIFMDIQMPKMTGYEATRAIRALAHPDAQTIPIVAMTANAYQEDIQHALDAGMNAHLAKPVDIGNVMRLLAELPD